MDSVVVVNSNELDGSGLDTPSRWHSLPSINANEANDDVFDKTYYNHTSSLRKPSSTDRNSSAVTSSTSNKSTSQQPPSNLSDGSCSKVQFPPVAFENMKLAEQQLKTRSNRKPINRPSFRLLSAAIGTSSSLDSSGGGTTDSSELGVPGVVYPRQISVGDDEFFNPGRQRQKTPKWPDHATSTVCPMCRSIVETTLRYKTGNYAIILSCLLATTGIGLLGLFVLPFCCHHCLDIRHHCPVCNELLGIHSRRFPDSLRSFRCVL